VEYVKFRIGQVIRHKIHGYRAVIIGWDETARAPEQWLKEHSVNRERSICTLTFLCRNIKHNQIIPY